MPYSSSLLLSSLRSSDLALLQPFLKPVHLEQKTVLYEDGGPITKVYFPTSAVVSLVVGLSTGETTEAAMVGRDGVTGATAALDGKLSLSLAIVQLGGDAFVCEVAALEDAALKSRTLLSKLMRHEQTLFSQAQQSAACMASHDVEARLCRWLLRSRDLTGSDSLNFTQEFLAQMLGVRRTSVTTTALTLQQAGVIEYNRGRIKLLKVDEMRDAACECYNTVNLRYELLLNPS